MSRSLVLMAGASCCGLPSERTTSHVGAAGKHTSRAGNQIVVTVASNPSHLEAVDPVVEGMSRAWQDQNGDRRRERYKACAARSSSSKSGTSAVS